MCMDSALYLSWFIGRIQANLEHNQNKPQVWLLIATCHYLSKNSLYYRENAQYFAQAEKTILQKWQGRLIIFNFKCLYAKKQQNIVINIWHITHITYDQTVKQNWPHWEETFTTDFNKHCNMYLQLLQQKCFNKFSVITRKMVNTQTISKSLVDYGFAES